MEGKILLKDAVTSDKQITGTEAVKPDMGKEPVMHNNGLLQTILSADTAFTFIFGSLHIRF